MKRKLIAFKSLFIALITVLSLNSCEEVVHYYSAEVTIMDNQGHLMKDVKVTTDVDVDELHIVGKEAYTDASGTVAFEFDNEAIMKVTAEYENYTGEGLIVLEEDKNVKVTVVVYE